MAAPSRISDTILVAYPAIGRSALRELAAEPAAAASITIMLDSTEHLGYIDAMLGLRHPELRVCLEADASWRPLGRAGPHIGTRRSPVRSVRETCRLANSVLRRGGFRIVGVMAYEGRSPASVMRRRENR